MFTGLIQSVGTLRRLEQRGDSAVLQVASELVTDSLELGESIAINGVCLTLTAWDRQGFSADVSPETLLSTTLGSLKPGAKVNLERALRLCDRLGGHLVSGHVDSVATLKKRYQDQNAVRMDFTVPEKSLRYLVEKGSVAVDGISLTVNQVDEQGFSVAVIPHSLANTTLEQLREGALVNIETDILGRYVERFLQLENKAAPRQGISLELLAKNGFL